MNKKGFTLIELLAAMVILGIIMAVAVPNVMGILRKSRDNTYVSDAKKLVSLAEYKFRAGKGIEKPVESMHCIVMSLKYLDNSEFEKAPNGGIYDVDRSYVAIRKTDNNFSYYVTLVEKVKGDSYRGVRNIYYDGLYNEEASQLVKNGAGGDFANVDSLVGIHEPKSTICSTIDRKYN